MPAGQNLDEALDLDLHVMCSSGVTSPRGTVRLPGGQMDPGGPWNPPSGCPVLVCETTWVGTEEEESGLLIKRRPCCQALWGLFGGPGQLPCPRGLSPPEGWKAQRPSVWAVRLLENAILLRHQRTTSHSERKISNHALLLYYIFRLDYSYLISISPVCVSLFVPILSRSHMNPLQFCHLGVLVHLQLFVSTALAISRTKPSGHLAGACLCPLACDSFMSSLCRLISPKPF